MVYMRNNYRYCGPPGKTASTKKDYMMKKLYMPLLAMTALCALSIGASAKTTINLCTGADGGPYHQAGKMIASQLSGNPNLDINVIADTGGTWGNIQRSTNVDSSVQPTDADYAAGTHCQAFIGQPDGPVYLARKNPGEASNLRQVGKLHREYLHVLCSKASGIENLGDIPGEDKASVAIGGQGSGAWLLWNNFIFEDEKYGTVATSTESGISAVAAVANGEISCALQPAGLNNQMVKQADVDFGKDLVLAEAVDKDFNDALDMNKKPLYEFVSIPGGTYAENLQSGWGTSVDTVSWIAGVYVNKTRLKDEKTLAALITAVSRARPAIEQQFGE
jgi:TRAP-type uncharacterized transport system substrate-binding protein